MYIKGIKFENFRNFIKLDLMVNQGFTVLYGSNGSGKTNFLEGIKYGAGLQKFTNSGLRNFFSHHHGFFRIKIEYKTGKALNQKQVFIEKKDQSYIKQYKINEQSVEKNKYLYGLPVVSFEPDDLRLLFGSPERRRKYLDSVLVQNHLEYSYSLKQYQKALKQRNDLLQKMNDKKVLSKELDVWDEQCAKFGVVVTGFRGKYINFLNKEITAVLEVLSPGLQGAEVVYRKSGWEETSGYLEKMFGSKDRDVLFKTTGVGPHRDDFFIKYTGLNIVGELSRGQVRSFVLALKNLEKKYIEQNIQISPILLLDDVLSELDESHQKNLIEFSNTLNQVFISTAHIEEIERFLPIESTKLLVENGGLHKI